MDQASGSVTPKDDMTPSKSGPWCRKPLWVVEMQTRGEVLAAASIEMTPLASSPGSLPLGSGGSRRQTDNSTDEDTWLENDDHKPSPGRSSVAPASDPGLSSPQRHLTLLDLLSIGIGGTVGSGIFVLCGLIAHSYAGPATAISFAISGLAAAASGCCYAELAAKIPVSGSTYAYAYVSIGELAAVISAALLTLEYGVSGSAVARSWGDKVMETIDKHVEGDRRWMFDKVSESFLNPLAFLLSLFATITLLSGVKESKRVVNAFTIIKLLLVIFLMSLGFVHSRRENWTPFLPPRFGVAGICRGATSAFFGFLGFDEVVCLAGESVNPKRDLAPSVILTIGGVSILYILAALSLSGMQPYEDISEASGFPEAFRSLGLNWAANIAALGEIICLPLVVLICLLAQPRLLQALARDDLLPARFGDLDFGTLCSGIAMAIIALCVPFSLLDGKKSFYAIIYLPNSPSFFLSIANSRAYLDIALLISKDFISSGVLLAFCITNNAVVLLRKSSQSTCDEHILFELCYFNSAAFLGAFLLCYHYFYAAILPTLIAVVLASRLGYRVVVDGQKKDDSFEAPICLPFIAIFVNAALIFQLEPLGLAILVSFISLCVMLYFWRVGSRDIDVKRWKE